MLTLVRLTLLSAVCFCSCQALRCRFCQGSPEKCENDKTEKECSGGQVCANFFYFNDGRPYTQKDCYQDVACKIQEGEPDNRCGVNDGKDKPCRCCCKTNNCNEPVKGCLIPGKCKPPKNPKNGKYTCPKNTPQGSVCTFACEGEYEVSGSKIITCVRGSGAGNKLVWNPLNQRCTRTRCKPLQAPKNGAMQCVNKKEYVDKPDFIYLDTGCSFTCDDGFVRKGFKKTVCLKTSKWSRAVPTCVPDPCDPFPKSPNRVDTCTNGNMLGSVCSFKCKKGYKLVGSKQTKCGIDQKDKKTKEWDKEPPVCVQIKCTVQNDPAHGSVSCTNKNFENSVCTFTCDVGYDVDDTDEFFTTTKCVDDEDGDDKGEWTKPPATCTRIVCKPKLTKPKDGSLECPNNFLFTVCTYKCDFGYDLEDTAKSTIKSTCEDDGNGDSVGKWSYYPPPTCTKIKCLPPHKDPENGKVSCSDVNNLASVCEFRCNKGYDLDGTIKDMVESECEDDGNGDAVGKWSRKAPTCTIKECEAIVASENLVFECSDDFRLSSTCEFECEFGFTLIGERKLECMDRKRDGDAIGEWSHKVPGCSQIFCKAQKHDDTVVRSCDPEGTTTFAVDTVCTYTCAEEGHYMVSFETPTKVISSGSSDVKCLESGKWNKQAPKCIPVKCPMITIIKNGHPPSCTKSNWLESVCGFVCLPSYKLTHTEELVCVSDGNDNDKTGKWSIDPPECKKNECEDFGQRPNGKITYSKGLEVGSVLTLVCNSGYTYKRYETAECLPKGRASDEPDWSRQGTAARFVCCVKCLFNKRLRVVMLVDKSAATNKDDWNEIVTWNYYLLDFLFTKEYEVKFALVLYDDDVDEENSLPERSLVKLDDVEDVQYAMYDFPHGGKSSDTTKALEYAKTTYFSRYSFDITSRRPKEEPYIIVIKRPGEVDPAVPKEILGNKIHILDMGFKRDNWKQEQKYMTEITQNKDRAFIIGGIPDVVKVGEAVTAISKEQGCAAITRNQDCSK